MPSIYDQEFLGVLFMHCLFVECKWVTLCHYLQHSVIYVSGQLCHAHQDIQADTCVVVSLNDLKTKYGLFTITGTREVERSAPSSAEITPLFQDFSPKMHCSDKTRSLDTHHLLERVRKHLMWAINMINTRVLHFYWATLKYIEAERMITE